MRQAARILRWLVIGGSLVVVSLRLPAGSLYKSVATKDGGTIKGKVALHRAAPQTFFLDVTKDNDWCGRKKQSPRLAIGKGKGVRNAIVSLVGVTHRKKIGTRKVLLNQKNCEFDPHVLLLPSGADLQIVNSDGTLHNVRASAPDGLTAFNIAQPVKNFRFTVKADQLKTPGIYSLLCDAGHPWMSGFIAVMEHPYYALTDADGNFILDDIPPGNYKLKMWHEGVHVSRTETESGKTKSYSFEQPYEETQEVAVEPGGTVNVEFELSLRPPPLTAK